jgi:flagellar FliJ protein
MKTFRFRLDPVLEGRRRAEEDRAADLSRARRLADEARAHREALEAVLRAEETSFMGAATGTRRVGAVRNRMVVMEQIRARIQVAASEEEKALTEVQERARAFRSAHEDRAALSKLRDRRQENWSAEGVRREQAELDEAGRNLHFLARLRGGDA